MRKTAFLAFSGLLMAVQLAHGQSRDIDLKGADGTALKATYSPAAKAGPGIVLLHMCNSERKAWANLAQQLAARGFHTVTMDYRGFGESGGRRFSEIPFAEQQNIVQQTWPGDIDAAFSYLLAQAGVDRTRIGVAGASCGVDHAIQFARRHPEVKTLVLLAGNITTPSGGDYLARSSWMPIFASAAYDDGNAVATMRWVLGFSSNPSNVLKDYKTGGHGTDMFRVHKDLEPAIASWFEQHLVKSPVKVTSSPSKPGPSAVFSAQLREPGGAARILGRMREARKAGKTIAVAPELAINLLGYEYLNGGRIQDAIQLFELNVEAYPNSSNTYDSLSDGYLAAGDQAKAIEFAQKAIDAIAHDTLAPDTFKQQIRESAEGKLKRLKTPAR
jgi:pimeloyl-ACP methyl ester carboxylesterase